MFETEWQQIRKLLANKNGWSMKNIYYLQNEHARQKGLDAPLLWPRWAHFPRRRRCFTARL
jgi:hypothetical protein